ncbi:hypothetical protein DIPPA_30121 [Diplonema papillatum]|nr:hypothetical protein DIPPA_30121 [Diplonema papillatum]
MQTERQKALKVLQAWLPHGKNGTHEVRGMPKGRHTAKFVMGILSELGGVEKAGQTACNTALKGLLRANHVKQATAIMHAMVELNNPSLYPSEHRVRQLAATLSRLRDTQALTHLFDTIVATNRTLTPLSRASHCALISSLSRCRLQYRARILLYSIATQPLPIMMQHEYNKHNPPSHQQSGTRNLRITNLDPPRQPGGGQHEVEAPSDADGGRTRFCHTRCSDQVQTKKEECDIHVQFLSQLPQVRGLFVDVYEALASGLGYREMVVLLRAASEAKVPPSELLVIRAIMSCKGDCNAVPKAVALYESLAGISIERTVRVRMALFSVHCSVGNLDEAVSCVQEMEGAAAQSAFEPAVVRDVSIGLVTACALKASRPKDDFEAFAESVFERAIGQDLGCKLLYACMMRVYASTGNASAAVRLREAHRICVGHPDFAPASFTSAYEKATQPSSFQAAAKTG